MSCLGPEKTLQEVIALQQENHLASQAVIREIRLLVEKRLAKQISMEEFTKQRVEAETLRASLHSRHNELRAHQNELRAEVIYRDPSR